MEEQIPSLDNDLDSRYNHKTTESSDDTGNSFKNSIVKRVVDNNEDFVAAFVGKRGSGKSYAALRLAETLSEILKKKFNVSNVIFSTTDFINLLDSLKHKNSKGEIIIYDESGIGIHSRRFQTESNISTGEAFQIIRYLNCIILLTAPRLSMIDAEIRRMLLGEFESEGVDKNKGVSHFKFKFLEYSDVLKKDLKPFFRNVDDDVISGLEFSMPSEELINAYEKKKRKFATELITKMQGKMNTKNEDRVEFVQEKAKEVISNFNKFKGNRGGLDANRIKVYFKVGEPTAKDIRSAAQMMLAEKK